MAKSDKTRINRRIRAPEVRVIDDKGEQLGIMKIEDALKIAREKNLDLIEVAPKAKPPVCKLLDYGKYKFNQRKKEKDAKKNQKIIHVKEIKMRPKIDEHDYNFKKKHIEKFLSKGDKVKVMIIFRGREIVHKEQGEAIINRLRDELKDISVIEKGPKFEGRNIIMVVGPASSK